MFKRADFIDLYSLADPERCKNYIVVAESALKKLFVKVQLNPRLGPDGTFMVQKLEGLQKKFLPTYDCAIRETSHLSHRGGSRITGWIELL